MKFESKFNIGDTVYLKTDIHQVPHIVVSVGFLPGGTIQYSIKNYKDDSIHFECELSKEVDIVMKTSN